MALELSSTTTTAATATLTALVHFIFIVDFFWFFFCSSTALVSWKDSSYVSDAVLGWPTQLPRRVTSVCSARQPQSEPQPQSKLGSRLMMCNFWALCMCAYVCTPYVCVCVGTVSQVWQDTAAVSVRQSSTGFHITPFAFWQYAHFPPPPFPSQHSYSSSSAHLFSWSHSQHLDEENASHSTQRLAQCEKDMNDLVFCGSLASLMSYRCMFCIMRWMIHIHK